MNISLNMVKTALARFIGRFHIIIFVITILGGLVVVILFLNNIIITSTDSSDYTPASNNASFDQTTIDRIKQLKTRDETGDQLNLPPGRTNPFVE